MATAVPFLLEDAHDLGPKLFGMFFLVPGRGGILTVDDSATKSVFFFVTAFEESLNRRVLLSLEESLRE